MKDIVVNEFIIIVPLEPTTSNRASIKVSGPPLIFPILLKDNATLR